ncbi:MAG: type II toxin-antitoxin system Phd/YefM family antitoxin [Spirochaetes bacterium]|nr:MAG: type II toxin-antitoxin system Phd/YefM family antitoxin [Spirochaetota bacterium]
MKIASIAEVKSKLSKYIKDSHNVAVVITKNGKPAAVLLAIENDDQLERIILSESKIFQNIIHKSEKQITSDHKFKHDAFWKQSERNT